MMTNFFIICSGANKDILRECPTERTKFVGIGATIFLTAVLASISGGYAIYFTFNNFYISLLFGLLWGIIIFNLDRYIVSSIKKTGNRKDEFFTALPRFLIAVVLAFTISKPLEIKLFDGSISKKMGENEDNYNKKGATDFNDQVSALAQTKSKLESELDTKKNVIFSNDPIFKDLSSQREENQKNINEWNTIINKNTTIINNNSWLEEIMINQQTGLKKTVRRYNQVAVNKINENKKLNENIADARNEIVSIEDSIQSRKKDLDNHVKEIEIQYAAQIQGVQQQINDLNAKRPQIISKIANDAAADKDVLSRLRALSDLSTFGNSVWWADLLISLLFVLLECAPIFTKLLSKRGPYDEILDRLEYEVYVNQQKIISDKNDEINNSLQYSIDTNKIKRESQENLEKLKFAKELSTNESILDEIAKQQTELAKAMIAKWYEEELSKIK